MDPAIDRPFWNERGFLELQALPDCTDQSIGEVCPFSNESRNESEIAAEIFSPDLNSNTLLGKYLALYVGYATDGNFRKSGSSGGIGKWLLAELLDSDHVDFVIHVVPGSNKNGRDELFHYDIVSDPADIMYGSRSAYYPVDMSGVLEHIRKTPARYAITAVPCFVKALRLIARKDPVFKERIRFCLGMFCGHMKSRAYAESLAWQIGVQPESLTGIDFRGKLSGKPANIKGLSARNGVEQYGPIATRQLFGGGYNLGFFQHKACDYCDDVVAETADVAIGDAWLPEYIKDSEGTSIVIVRHPDIDAIIRLGIRQGRLLLDTIDEAHVIESQSGGFRHRREGLAFRLELADSKREWRPRKRIKPDAKNLSSKRKDIYLLRMKIAEASHDAFLQARQIGDIQVFNNAMTPLVDEYNSYYRPKLAHRIKRGIVRRWKKLRNVTKEIVSH